MNSLHESIRYGASNTGTDIAFLCCSRKQQIDRSNISKEHTDLIVSELNVPKLVAEKALIDNNNDVRAALTQLITQ